MNSKQVENLNTEEGNMEKVQFRNNVKDGEGYDEEKGYRPRLNEVAQKFITDLVEEKSRIGDAFPLCSMLIDEAIERIQLTGRVPGTEIHADVFKQKPMKLSQTVFVPVKQFPKFNFTGKILGPKGNSLRRLQEETQCKIIIKGRHSMRDTGKEEELRKSGDPRHAHLNKNLFLVISTVGPPAECYARVAYALAEIRKYLIPDKNDEVSQEQLREIMNDPELSKDGPKSNGAKKYSYKSVLSNKGIQSSGEGLNKYMSLINKTTDYEEDDDQQIPYHDSMNRRYENESQRRGCEYEEFEAIPKLHKPQIHPNYSYGRVRAVVSEPLRMSQKRVAMAPQYPSDVKRVREYAPYQQQQYGIHKKYQ